jgi:hypothetical protein
MARNGRFRAIDADVKAEAFVTVGGTAAFPYELPYVARHRAWRAEVRAVLAQQNVAVATERKMHVAKVSE